MRVEITPGNVLTGTTDDRGRITLGTEHKNKYVEIAILNEKNGDAHGDC